MENTPIDACPMEGKLLVVAGATGNVGEGVTRSFLRAGAKVIALSRSDDTLEKLFGLLKGEEIRNLIGMAGDTGTFDGMAGLAERIRTQHGPVHHVVASLGEWWQGKPVWETTEAEFQRYFVQTTALHFGAARALVPIMEDRGSYTMLAGLSAVMPFPAVALIGMQGGAQLMLGQELQADVGDRLRINNLILGFIVSRSRPTGKPSWLTADDVGELIVRIAGSNIAGRQIRADDRIVAQRSLGELGA